MISFLQYDKTIQKQLTGKQYLEEKLLQLASGKPYGQIILLNGGPGSGKSFARSKFIDSEKFKIIDADQIRGLYIAMKKMKMDPEYENLDLKNPEHTARLHYALKPKGFNRSAIENIIKSADKSHLPNIILDRPFASTLEIEDYINTFVAIGYERKNIHMVWVLTDYNLSVKQNQERDRVVPSDIQLQSHENIAKSMFDYLDGHKQVPFDGGMYLILNDRENVIWYEKEMRNVKDFKYLILKYPQKPIISPDTFHNTIRSTVASKLPKTDALKAVLERVPFPKKT